MAMPLDAAPPTPPSVSGAWDRLVETSVIQESASARITAGGSVAAIEPILELEALTLEDIEVRMPPGVGFQAVDVAGPQARDPSPCTPPRT